MPENYVIEAVPWLRGLEKRHPSGCIGDPDSNSGMILDFSFERGSTVELRACAEGSTLEALRPCRSTDRC